MNERLIELGFTEKRLLEAENDRELVTGRVIARDKNYYRVATANGDLQAAVAGRFHYQAQEGADYPAVGDFVLIDRDDQSSGTGVAPV